MGRQGDGTPHDVLVAHLRPPTCRRPGGSDILGWRPRQDGGPHSIDFGCLVAAESSRSCDDKHSCTNLHAHVKSPATQATSEGLLLSLSLFILSSLSLVRPDH